MSFAASSRVLSFARWIGLLLLPLACAVATGPGFSDPETGGGSSSGSSTGVGGSVAQVAGSHSAFGGAAGVSGASSTTAGKGGVSAVGGQSHETGGAGMAAAGSPTGGASAGAGGQTGGGAGGGVGGGSNVCQGLTAWKGGDPTLTIAQGEVVVWMGKRYKANVAIAYPNTECAPDAPVEWCANWFTVDGDC